MDREKQLLNMGKEILNFNPIYKEQCINNAIELSSKSIKRDKSFFEVLRTQMKVISKLSWSMHIMIIFCVSLILYYCMGMPGKQIINLLFVLLGPILQLIVIPEILISYRYKVWQMEQCAVVTLAQLIVVRIAIWQTINFIYIIGLTLILHNFIDVIDMTVYIFIPYNLSNAVAFCILKYTRRNATNILCIFIDFLLMLLYYGGAERKLNNTCNALMGELVDNLFVFWAISFGIFIFSIMALYKNVSYERVMNYGFIN